MEMGIALMIMGVALVWLEGVHRKMILELNTKVHKLEDHVAWQQKQLLMNAERDEDFAKIAAKHTEMLRGLQHLGSKRLDGTSNPGLFMGSKKSVTE